jgi:general secretion pathway protein K
VHRPRAHRGAPAALVDCRSMPAGSQSGFALIMVIWAIGLLALMFVTYVAAARYRAIEARSLSEHARAEAASSQGVHIAVLDLLSGLADGVPSSARYRLDGTPFFCVLADGSRMAIAVADEGGKVDLNTASPELIQALTRGVHPNAQVGASMTRKILSLREAALASQSAKGIASPSAAAFKTVLELDQLTEGDQNLFHRLKNLTTVHSRSQGFDPRVAPMELVRLTSPGGRAVSRHDARAGLPAAFTADSQGRAFLISAEVMTANGTRFARDAMVVFLHEKPHGHDIREWRDGSLRVIEQAAGNLPPC